MIVVLAASSERLGSIMLLPLVLSIWLLLPSATSQDLLQCNRCANLTQATCKKNVVTCSASDTACVSYYEKGTVGTKHTTLFLMMCGTCDMFRPTSVRFHRGTVKSNSTCCTKSSCIPPEPTIEPDRLVTKNGKIVGNGVICKSCYTTAKSCDCNAFVNCTGQESLCIHRNTVVTGEHSYLLAVRGCTTNQTCEAPKLKADKTKPFTMSSDSSCSSSEVLLHSPLLWFLSVIFLLFFRPITR
ncbi:phospholipase A2 inhibitor subunit gamma B-like [Rana temporaria]|uniref:phospholipase A2 inhibitor subunit gamma B-like n=1 Tax=Rana temporaria TaxID=8407 RepID=UPI001AAC4896|nr:phospholipase A2 inhibitor subunit gamma B-like [Rana temporaria]